MKNKRKYYFLILILLILLVLIWNTNPTYNKKLQYQNIIVEYEQYYWGKKDLYEGHEINNDMLFLSANMNLAYQLCEQYKRNPNQKTKNKILEITRKFKYSKFETYKLNFDSLINNYNQVFDTTIYID